MAMESGQQWRRAAFAAVTLALLAAFLPSSSSSSSDHKVKVCIVGSGMAGASAAHFLRNYSELEQGQLELDVYERHGVVGGRMAMVDLLGDRFEAGASILHPKNLHAVRFVQLLGLKRKLDSDSEGFGIWDGNNFVFRTIDPGKSFIYQKIASWINSLSLLWRYGKSLFKMQAVVARLLERFLHLYQEDRAPYATVKDLLDSVDLYAYTQHSLDAELLREGLSSRLITELVTVITRINYGQNVTMSGLAGVVALCGSGDNLWAVKGGNWQMADGLIKRSNVSLHLNETVASVTSKNGVYEVATLSGKVEQYDAVIIATPLDESKISFSPSVNLPKRSMHHTFATFVRGLVNPAYFGLKDDASVPDLVATLEIPGLPFISISVLKKYNETDKAYKIFSRAPLSDDYLDQVFSVRNKTIQIDWAAYPEFEVPEVFAPIVLDGNHLYYINSFENAASTMETSAVAAENVVRLLLTRLSGTSVLTKPVVLDSFLSSKVAEEL